MSDTFTTDDEPSGESQENANIRLLRQKAETADKATQEAAQLRRELAVVKSGVDAESKLGQLFLKSYDGENTPEAIKAAAEDFGIPFKGAETEVVEPPVDSGTDVRTELADGTPVGSEPAPDPNQIALQTFQEAIKSGSTEEAAAALFFNTLAEAASRGDERVIVR